MLRSGHGQSSPRAGLAAGYFLTTPRSHDPLVSCFPVTGLFRFLRTSWLRTVPIRNAAKVLLMVMTLNGMLKSGTGTST
eukprot:CAMPEP_0182544220 /NCGR_PEP_ID=MMETSP1323-20130603/32797_1 /TAXON_ID=236787 /ORGANISM="Florenciella parvula, Strain RCC1693" /LENGTH=78 /DNA_ID=CAMNT_0024755225 /DNA_START=190 /DNA_END=422 /DNA_ORIENTATION=-